MKNAFSLVELSIVLVILGLLVGGVLTGQSLIRAAELRSVTTQSEQYVVAIQTFRDRFFALPGDMRNATDFWGNAGSGATGGECANSQTNVGTGTQTCNGDGNGRISLSGLAAQHFERYRAWEHLANAGLVEGSYTGVSAGGANTTVAVIGQNVPPARFANAGFSFHHHPNNFANASVYSTIEGNLLFIGGQGALETTIPIFAPEESWNIDTKRDDGQPDTGNVRTFKSANNPNCTTSDADDGTAEYALTQTGDNCSMLLYLGIN